MRLHLFLGLLFWLPSALIAQEAILRSGEHEGFTRIVAPIPVGAEWQIAQIEREVRFSVSGNAPRFDTSQVFDLIPRERVQTVSIDNGDLIINLGCDCRVAPFLATERYVAIDITSPGVSRPAPFVSVSQTPVAAPSANPNILPTTTARAAQSVTLPIVPTPSQQQALEPLGLPQLLREPLNEREREVLDNVQNRLARELGTAATRGLLTPTPGIDLPSINRPQIDTSALVTEEPAAPESAQIPEPSEPTNNMRITSSMDLPNIAISAEAGQTLTGLSCPTNAELDVSGWAEDSSFDEQTGEARMALFGEFDRLNRDVALRLSRMYIHFGFGAEALQILALDPQIAEEEPLLGDLARIMEDGVAGPDSILPQLLDCETDAALWAILAREELDVARTIDPKAALRALNKLPLHLRQFLAPALSRRLLSHGDTDAAATAMRNLERRTDNLPSSAKLAQANIAMDEGNVERATSGFQDVIDDNAEQSPEALITLVETKLAENQPIDPETAGLVEAFAKELQGSELGPDLRRAHVLALLKSGQFDSAFRATAELGGGSEEKSAVDLRLTLLTELTAAASDIVFLDHVFDQPSRDIQRLRTRPKLALATRLLDLGFAQEAQDIVEGIPARPSNEARQILEARAALALEMPERAQSALADIAGEEAAILKAEAKHMAGAHAEAYALFRQTNQDKEAARAAWLADDWREVTLGDNPLFGPVLTLTETEFAPSSSPDGMLARTSAALDESAAARQTLADLLRAPELELDLGEPE